jgi:hypothetical protein
MESVKNLEELGFCEGGNGDGHLFRTRLPRLCCPPAPAWAVAKERPLFQGFAKSAHPWLFSCNPSGVQEQPWTEITLVGAKVPEAFRIAI